MATTSQTSCSSLSGEAYDLIDCFYNGVDRIVYEVAESFARKRTGIGSRDPVVIEAEDVRAAGAQVIEALSSLGTIHIPDEIQDELKRMDDCMNSK